MDLVTIGFASQAFQEHPDILKVALRGVKAAPQLTLNGLEYFLRDDVVKALAWVAQCDTESGRMPRHAWALSEQGPRHD